MTNENIKNPYLRGLLAREMLGYRKVYRKMRLNSADTHTNMTLCINSARDMAFRVDLHLRRHGIELMLGDPSPLSEYPPSFAGH